MRFNQHGGEVRFDGQQARLLRSLKRGRSVFGEIGGGEVGGRRGG